MTRRLSDDWLEAHGHRVLLAETFCDPEAFAGTMYRAAGWEGLGETKGFARANGRYTDPHGKPKAIFVTALRPDARELLSSPQPLPPDVAPPAGPGLAPRDPEAMRSLHAELAAVPDFRRAQGKKHTVACVLTVHVLADLTNMKGCLAAAQFAHSLSQEELEAVGAWTNRRTGLREPVSKSTLHQIVQSVDPEALEDVVGRWSRLPVARALAADGKRIRGANRNGDGHHETVALVDHESGAPFALLVSRPIRHAIASLVRARACDREGQIDVSPALVAMPVGIQQRRRAHVDHPADVTPRHACCFARRDPSTFR